MNKALTHPLSLKIALLGYRSHPHVGGQGVYLYYLSKALSEMGHQVTVFSGPPYPELCPRVSLVKIPCMDLYAKAKPLRSLRLKNLFSHFDRQEWFSKLSGSFAEPRLFSERLFKYHLEELKTFDVLHDNQCLGSGLIKLQQAGCKVVATIHHPIHRDREFALKTAKDWFHRVLIRRWYNFIRMQEKVSRKLTSVHTVSVQSKKDIITHFQLDDKQVTVIPNGIDTTIFRPLLISKFSKRLVSTASSDQAIKGLHILIEAFDYASARDQELELVIIGKLKKHSQAYRKFQKLKSHQKDKIVFKSGLSTEEIVQEYATAAIGICPSLYEGFGIPALEAMACGLPLISSDGGALPEVVGDAGHLFESGNSSALGEEIIKLVNDTALQLQLSKKALERVSNNFKWQTIANQYTDFYLSCIDEHVNA